MIKWNEDGMNQDADCILKSSTNRAARSSLFGESYWSGVTIICILVLLAYSSVFHAGFIWDDDSYITENPYLENLSGLFRIWVSPGATPQYYPMVFSVFWLENHLWGQNPAGYHLVNIFIHILNALLVWTALRHLRFTWAFWAAIIFALHPVHVETVAWVTELKNVLSHFFYMLALLAYFRFLEIATDDNKPAYRLKGYYAVAFICFLLALLSKTVTATLPAVILLLLWWRDGRIIWKDIAKLVPFFIVGVSMGLFTARLEVTHVSASGPEWSFSFLERILIAGRAVWFYAGKLLWPHPLIFSYPRWTINAEQWAQYLFPSGVLLAVGVLWLLRRKIGRGPLTSLLFFIGTLFPALCFFNIYPMRYSFVADHFQYAASIGVICLFCASTDFFFRRFRHEHRLAEVGYYGGILLILCLTTWHHGKTYKNTMVLYSDIIEKNPTSWLSYTNRSMENMDQGRYDLAVADMEKALETHPNKSEAFGNRAVLRQRGGDFQGALADFSKAIELEPSRVEVLINRSDLYLLLNNYYSALKDCNDAITLKKDYVAGYLQRARVYGSLENNGLKVEDYSMVLQIDPGNLEALAERGLTYFQMGQVERAIHDFSTALKVKHDSAALYYRRAQALVAAGARERAHADYQHARRLGYQVSESELINTTK